MNHWPFILAAYGATLVGTLGLALWSWGRMRSAEGEADALRGDRTSR